MNVTIRAIPREADLRFHTDTVRFTVLQAFSCTVNQSGMLLSGSNGTRVHEIPAGFDTDLASIPRFLLSTTGGKVGKHLIAAIVHDYLYRTGFASRELADEIFLAAMKNLGVSWLRRNVFYRAVRLGGKSSYMAKPVLTAP